MNSRQQPTSMASTSSPMTQSNTAVDGYAVPVFPKEKELEKFMGDIEAYEKQICIFEEAAAAKQYLAETMESLGDGGGAAFAWQQAYEALAKASRALEECLATRTLLKRLIEEQRLWQELTIQELQKELETQRQLHQELSRLLHEKMVQRPPAKSLP